ncbi:MAG: GNAT family N-acetyltransferase [Geminicoccaceae bacterium]|nr:GNAT family N-acetyltransferase [Geminicoccaceae bacterium]MCB9942712.1 GNAT family N-acetyltransferase [Geminicoccaceae bacterium]
MLASRDNPSREHQDLSRVTIKVAGPFDLGRISRLHRACFADGWSRSDVAHLLALPGSFGLFARLNHCGFPGLDSLRGAGFSLCRVVRDECELLSIGVIPASRRQGVARALLQASMVHCHMAGAKKMFLEVAIDNPEAQALYAEHGFETVGTRPNYYQRADGTRAHAYTMEGSLLFLDNN